MRFRIFAESINSNSWLIDYVHVLSEAGHEVSTHSGLFKKLPSGSLNKKRLINNVLIHAKVLTYSIFDLFSVGIRPSYLVSSTPVGLIAFAGLVVSSKIRLIAIMMDLYPHTIDVNLPALRRASNFINWLHLCSMRRYQKVLVVDDFMEQKITKFFGIKVPDIDVCGLFVDGARTPLNVSRHPKGRILRQSDVIQMFFAGHLTRMHQRPDLIERLQQIHELNRSCHTVLHVVGNSAATKQYFEHVEVNTSVITCKFYGYMPERELGSLMKSCHFGLVMLADDYRGYCLPSKLFDNRLNGIKSLYIGPVSQVIRSLSSGIWVVDESLSPVEQSGSPDCSQALLRSRVIECCVVGAEIEG